MAQVLSVSKSLLIIFSKSPMFLNFCKRDTSSAKSEMSQFILSSMSFMYIRKSNGDRMEPWGNEANISRFSDVFPA